MFMLGKATSNKGWVSFRARVIFFSISQEDEPQESSYGGTLIVVCF